MRGDLSRVGEASPREDEEGDVGPVSPQENAEDKEEAKYNQGGVDESTLGELFVLEVSGHENNQRSETRETSDRSGNTYGVVEKSADDRFQKT